MSRDLSSTRALEELTAATLMNVRERLAGAPAGAGAWFP